MKFASFLALSVFSLSAVSHAEDQACNRVRSLTQALLSEKINAIKERVNHDKEELYNSEFVQNRLRPDANDGRPYLWIGNQTEHGGYRTYMNIYRASDMFPRNEIDTWSGGERWKTDSSPDVLSMVEMMNSLRAANGLSSIAVNAVHFQQDSDRRFPLNFKEIEIKEDDLQTRTVTSIEELSERYLLPRFCSNRFADHVSTNDSERSESRDSGSRTFTYSSSSSSSVRVQRSSSSVSNQ